MEILEDPFFLTYKLAVLIPTQLLSSLHLPKPVLSHPSLISCSTIPAPCMFCLKPSCGFQLHFKAQKTFLRAASSFSIGRGNSSLREEITFVKK